ncbi:beta-ketoacyl synthase N-terminal-like domain-containing protein, partial [Pseudoalteromonas holothuriae]|uniref:beta-ketoacyl synthase N-terminal-like domain-containing protein n=1 Tax=Pseudoalteromonas holothuriae TaxID=2963714 RepID=UPI0028FC1B63
MKNKKYSMTLSANHPILQAHQIDGRGVMPGLAYIDLIFQLLLPALKLEVERAEITKLAILRPLILAAHESVDLVFEVQPKALGWTVSVLDKHDTSEPYVDFHLSEMHDDVVQPPAINVDTLSGELSYDIQQTYQRAISLNLCHGELLQVSGNIFVGNDDYWAQIQAKPSNNTSSNFIASPAMLDGAAMAILYALQEQQKVAKSDLFLPIYIGAYKQYRPMLSKSLAVVKNAHISIHTNLLKLSIKFYTPKGQVVAEMDDLCVRPTADFQNALHNAERAVLGMDEQRHEGDQNSDLHGLLIGVFASYLGVNPEHINGQSGFFELGVTSTQLLYILKDLETQLQCELSPVMLFEHDSVAKLAAHLTSMDVKFERHLIEKVEPKLAISTPYGWRQQDIAIIGMAGRFAAADDVEQLWENLTLGKDSVAPLSPNQFKFAQDYATAQVFPCWGGVLHNSQEFDPLFFNIAPNEAERMDPQERLFLEVSWQALESSGHTPQSLHPQYKRNAKAEVGVYAAVMFSEYALYAADLVRKGHPVGVMTGISASANRLSYFCDFSGPSIGIDSMCSGSLTALSIACQGLRNNETYAAICGGVNVSVHPNKYLMLRENGFLSQRGRCASFGADADGYVPGEGVGVIILKRLFDAQQDSDQILAVIKGVAVNHGGRASGYTVPSPEAQKQVILKALSDAEICAQQVNYIETHGTGTQLGDPIEIAALQSVFAAQRDDVCFLGAIKSNLGHCESAAGVAGLIKVVLQLQHRKICPSIHSQTLNPHIDLSAGKLQLQHQLIPWPQVQLVDSNKALPRTAGVSSFGAGGTNAHLVLQEYPEHEVVSPDTGPVLFVLSAKRAAGLVAYA